MSKDIDFITNPQFNAAFHTAVSKTSPRSKYLLNMISKALIELRESNELDTIFTQYLLEGSCL